MWAIRFQGRDEENDVWWQELDLNTITKLTPEQLEAELQRRGIVYDTQYVMLVWVPTLAQEE